MSSDSLADSGLPRKAESKPSVATPFFGHRGAAMPRKKIHYDKIRSELQAVFVRRLNEEMEAREVSDNDIARRSQGRISQTNVSRITSGRQDTKLEHVEVIAQCLGVSPLLLLSDAFSSQSRASSTRTHRSIVRNEHDSLGKTGQYDKAQAKKKA